MFAKKIQLHLDGDTREKLQFLCRAYGKSPKKPLEARVVIRELVSGAWEGIQDALKAREAQLDAQSKVSEQSSVGPTEEVGRTEVSS